MNLLFRVFGLPFMLILGVVLGSSFAVADTTTDLVLRLPFDSNDDNATGSYTASSNDATLDNSVFKLGSGSYDFSGGQQIVYPDNGIYTFGTGDFTWHAWVRPTASDPSQRGTMLGDIGGSATDSNTLFTNQGGFSHDANTWAISKNSAENTWSATITADTWYQIVFVKNSSGITLYIDSVPQGAPWSYSETLDLEAFNVGSRGGSNYFDGRIDEVCIWHRALNNSAIDELYNSGSGQVCDFVAPVFDTDVTFLARDAYDSGSISNYTVNISGSTNTTTSATLKFDNSTIANNTITTVNITSNNSGGYFSQSIEVNYSWGSTIFLNITQVRAFFSAQEQYTANSFDSLNITAGSHSNSTTTGGLVYLPLKSELISFNANSSEQINRQFGLNLPALSTVNVTVNFTNAQADISAFNALTNTSIDGYQLVVKFTNLSDTLTYTTTTGNVSDIPMIKGYSANLTVTNSSFTTANKIFSVDATDNIFDLFLQKVHSFNFNIFDEILKTLLIQNVTLNFIGPDTSFNVSTGNGSIFQDNLTPGEWRINYDTGGYDPRNYYLDLPVGGSDDIDLYLLDTENASGVGITVKNQNFDEVENATVQALRFYTQTNSYEIISMERTAFDGTTNLNLQEGSPFYKFRILLDGVTRLDTIGSLITPNHVTNGINFQINTESDPLTLVENLVGVSNNVTFNPSNNHFTLAYVDNQNALTEACLQIKRVVDGSNSVINSSCITSNSASIVISVDNTTHGGVLAEAVFTGTSEGGDIITVIGDQESVFFDVKQIANTLGNYGLLLVAIFVVGLAFLFIINPKLVVLGGALGFIIPMMAGLTVFTVTAALGILAGAVIVNMAMRTTGE